MRPEHNPTVFITTRETLPVFVGCMIELCKHLWLLESADDPMTLRSRAHESKLAIKNLTCLYTHNNCTLRHGKWSSLSYVYPRPTSRVENLGIRSYKRERGVNPLTHLNILDDIKALRTHWEAATSNVKMLQRLALRVYQRSANTSSKIIANGVSNKDATSNNKEGI
jgi:hypothetical protein